MDCLFIGYNELEFCSMKELSKNDMYLQKTMGLQYINYKNTNYTLKDIFNHFNSQNCKGKDTFTPVGLGDSFSNTIAYLGTYLHRRGYSIDYVNTFNDYKDELTYKLRNEKVKCVAIPTTFYLSEHPIMEIVSFVREHNSETKIVVGGPFIAALVNLNQANQQIIQHVFSEIGADFYIYSSEGENTLSELVGVLKNNSPVDKIDNLFYLSQGRYLSTSNNRENNNLEENTVDWKLFGNNRYKVFNVRTSKSCPFRCSFCNYHQIAGEYTTVSVDAIERELDTLKERGHAFGIGFVDDTFNVPPNRFKEIMRMMIRNKYNFKWASYFRCQFADRETIELMKESGCEFVFLGIESANQKILDNMNKNVQVEDYKKGIALLNEYNITSVAALILGFPGETLQTYQDTIDFIEECKPTFFRSNIWYCDPFSPIFNQRDKFNIQGAGYDWAHSTMNSKTASDLEYDLMKKVKNSTWIKHYDLDASLVFSLISQGYSVQWIKKFVHLFNDYVIEKIESGTEKKISDDQFIRFENLFKPGK